MQEIRLTLYALRLIAKAEAEKSARFSVPHKIRPIKPRPMSSVPGSSASAFAAIQKLTEGR